MQETSLRPQLRAYQFWLAQQLLFPFNCQQVGPAYMYMYFRTPRKCLVFDVCKEADAQQVNDLIDEGDMIGKVGLLIIVLDKTKIMQTCIIGCGG